jgi:Ion channel
MKLLLTRKYDNYILFFSLAGVLFLLPFVNAMPLLRFALVGQYTFVMFYLVFSARHTRSLYLVDIAFVLPTLIATWLDTVYQNNYTFVASYLTMVIFFLYLQYLIIIQMIHAHKVDTNTIFGAMNIYLVAGLIWAYTFILLHHFDSSAFHLPDYEELSKEVELFTYYSYSTLTTLGYGDIVPESAQARMLSVLEAVFGQLYLAIVVAKLVSIYWRQEEKSVKES